MPQLRKRRQTRIIMGDKSPKAVNKKATQKPSKANSANQAKKQAEIARSTAGKKPGNSARALTERRNGVPLWCFSCPRGDPLFLHSDIEPVSELIILTPPWEKPKHQRPAGATSAKQWFTESQAR